MNLKRLLASVMVLAELAMAMPLALAASEDPFAPENVTLRFGVVSDLQTGRRAWDDKSPDYAYSAGKLKAAYQQLIDKAGGKEKLDAIVIGGDITQNGTLEQYNAYLNVKNELFPEGSHTQLLPVRGNHDNFGSNQDKYVQALGDPQYTATINGYRFILTGQDTSGSNGAGLHSASTISWFDTQMQTAAADASSPDQPIFVFTHPHIANTVYGSYPIEGIKNGVPYTKPGDSWGTTDFDAILPSYPQAVAFSGHSHYTITDERSIYQDTYTALGTGAVGYIDFEESWDESFQPNRIGSVEKENEGYYVEVNKDNQVRVTRMDFYRGEEIKQPWLIEPATNRTNVYTNNRDSDSPYFEPDAQVTISNLQPSSCRVTFDQAKDATSDVHHYTVELKNTATNEIDKIYTPFSYYHLKSDMPSYDYWDAKGLLPETTYQPVITAYDSFGNKSETPLTGEAFTTPSREIETITVADTYFTDSALGDNAPYSMSSDAGPKSFGSAPLAYNTEFKRYEATFSSSAPQNFFKVPLTQNKRKAMQTAAGYAIEVLYAPSDLPASSSNIIGGAERYGFDLEYSSGKKFETYIHNGGDASAWDNKPNYPGGAISNTKDAYQHVIINYDGKNVRVYNNGQLIETKPTTGTTKTLVFPTDVSSNTAYNDSYYGMVIGGDYKPTGSKPNFTEQTEAQAPFTGKIVLARLYSSALSDSEAQKRYDAIESRKNLAKADDLNAALSVDLAELKNSADVSISMKATALAEEGWRLMGREDLNEAQINAFLAKVEDLKTTGGAFAYPLTYSVDTIPGNYGTALDKTTIMNNYGMDFNSGDNAASIWSMQKINDVRSVYRPAMRISTQSNIGNRELFSLNFQNDQVNKPPVFTDSGYIYESEFAVQNKDDGYVALTLNGKDAGGAGKQIAQVRFTRTAGTNNGTAQFVLADGTPIGRALTFQMLSSGSEDNPAQLLYVKVAVDLKNQTYSAWLTPRKTEAGAYTEVPASDQNIMVSQQPLEGVQEFTGMKYNITKSVWGNSIWLSNINVTQYDPAVTPDISMNAQAFPAENGQPGAYYVENTVTLNNGAEVTITEVGTVFSDGTKTKTAKQVLANPFTISGGLTLKFASVLTGAQNASGIEATGYVKAGQDTYESNGVTVTQ